MSSSQSPDQKSDGRRFSIPVILTVVVIVLLIIFVKGCNDGAATKEAPAANASSAIPAS